jgi:hypothetical protein
MAEVDYGYGDQNDYGYGDAEPDMGYGVAEPDMGYGVAEPDMGYGDAAPDMGYGDAAPYSAPAMDEDYGYGDATPDAIPAAPPVDKRPKRRCSVTKFSLASETPLTAASVINDLRMGLPISVPPVSTLSDDCCGKSTVTDDTRSLDLDDVPTTTTKSECAPPQAAPKKNGVISRIRRRLSIVS